MRRSPSHVVAVVVLLALGMLTALGVPASAKSKTADFTIVPLVFPELQVTENEGIATLKMEGCADSRKVGEPVVPHRGLTVAVPPNTRATSVSMVDSKWHVLEGTYLVEWGQPPAPSEGELPERVGKDRSIYDSDKPYPKNPVDLNSTGKMRKVSLGSVSVYPVRYYPETGIIAVCTEMTVKVDYSSVEPEKRIDRSPASPDIADNAAQAQEWYQAPSGTGDIADYVVITPNALSASVNALKTYRESQGLSVNVTTTEWIYANCSGSDNPAKIRNFLKDRYLSWGIDYVLIVGTTSSVPMRTTRTADPATYSRYYADYHNVPTDYYYSDLSGDWDLNGNGYYGECTYNYYDGSNWQTYVGDDGPGGVDFYPEVYIGRIPSDNTTDIANICTKIVNYSGDSGAWKQRVLLHETVSNFENDGGAGYPATWGGALGESIRSDVTNPDGIPSHAM